MHDQNSIDTEETAAQKYQRALDLFTESVLKPDHNLRGCAYNQGCYEDLMEIGLNRAVDLIERDSGENILFTEPNSNLPVLLKNGRFGEYTEFDGFNKATKLPPEDKPKNPKVTYYNPHELDYINKDTQIFVMKSLRILGFQTFVTYLNLL